jgi:hypothetical protein
MKRPVLASNESKNTRGNSWHSECLGKLRYEGSQHLWTCLKNVSLWISNAQSYKKFCDNFTSALLTSSFADGLFIFGRYVGNIVLWRTYANPTLILTVRVSCVRGTSSQNHAISRKIGSQFLIIHTISTVNCLRCRCCPCSDVIFPLISTVEGQQTRILCLSLHWHIEHTGLSTLLCAQSKCSRQNAPTLHYVLIQFYQSQHISTRFEPGPRKRAFWFRGFHVLRKIHQQWHKHATC